MRQHFIIFKKIDAKRRFVEPAIGLLAWCRLASPFSVTINLLKYFPMILMPAIHGLYGLSMPFSVLRKCSIFAHFIGVF